jgi:hypothetical protein
MLYGERESVTATPDQGAVGIPTNSYAPSWRYIGDRAAADGAYCVRFSVTEAPEPYVVPGGAWAYALPITRAS